MRETTQNFASGHRLALGILRGDATGDVEIYPGEKWTPLTHVRAFRRALCTYFRKLTSVAANSGSACFSKSTTSSRSAS